MLDFIISAVAVRISGLFPDIEVHMDSQIQDLQKPCFFVGFTEMSEKPALARRCLYKYGILIRYLPKASDLFSRTVRQTAETLMYGLDCIALEDGSVLQASNKICHNKDGILELGMDFRASVIKNSEATEDMDKIEITTELQKIKTEERIGN